MKRQLHNILILFLLLCLSSELSAQKSKPKNKSWYDDKPFHFGFSIGLNTMDYSITPSQEAYEVDYLFPEVTSLNPGINIQIITNLRLNRYMDLRFLPGVSFGQRIINYYQNEIPYKQSQELESSYLEFPLTLKYKGERLNNVRPYVVAGANFRYDLSGKKEFNEDKPVYIRIKRPDLYYEGGAGLDFYLRYFKLGVELKVSQGINNLIVDDAPAGYEEYRSAIEKLKARIWVLSFHFE